MQIEKFPQLGVAVSEKSFTRRKYWMPGVKPTARSSIEASNSSALAHNPTSDNSPASHAPLYKATCGKLILFSATLSTVIFKFSISPLLGTLKVNQTSRSIAPPLKHSGISPIVLWVASTLLNI